MSLSDLIYTDRILTTLKQAPVNTSFTIQTPTNCLIRFDKITPFDVQVNILSSPITSMIGTITLKTFIRRTDRISQCTHCESYTTQFYNINIDKGEEDKEGVKIEETHDSNIKCCTKCATSMMIKRPNKCPICLDSMDSIPNMVMNCKCKHSIHISCMRKMYKNSPNLDNDFRCDECNIVGKMVKCPLCRGEVCNLSSCFCYPDDILLF